MVRQYIGARYVPKFYENSDNTSEWRSGVIYEPLTIVTYNGNSYTSKKPVPAEIGNPSSNPTYWAATGLYNEQVEEIRQRIEEVSGQLDDLQDDIDDVREEVDSLELTEAVWIGDSYVQAVSLGDNQSKRFATLVSNMLGLTEHNYAIGGSGFLAPSGDTFGEQLTAAIADMTEEERLETKYVFICGGRNDPYLVPTWTLADLNTAVSSVITAAKTNYPNATIVCVPMLWSANALDATQQRYLSEVNVCCQNTLAPVMAIKQGWTWLIGQQGLILSDGVHPTVAGHQIIAMHLYSTLKGADSYRAPIRYSITNNGMTIIIKMMRNRVDVHIAGTPTEAISFGGYIVQNYNLGQYGSIRVDSYRPIVLVGRDGSGCLVQINLSAAGNNIVFTAQVLSDTLKAQNYCGALTFENGMQL